MNVRYFTAVRTMVVATLALLLSLSTAAQQTRVYREGGLWVEETSGALAAAPNVSATLTAGNISVQGGPQSNVTYTLKKRVRSGSEAEARQQFDRIRFSAARNGDTVSLTSDAAGHWRNLSGVELIVQVPRNTGRAKLTTQGGNEAVTGITGRVEASTAGGNIRVDDISGTVTAFSGGGNVEVGSVGGDLVLKTGGGNVRVNSAKGHITTSSGGGNIMIESATEAVMAQTGGGSIDVKRCGGQLTAQTGGGSLDLGQIAGKAILHSGGGSISLLSASGPVVANTGGGTIALYGLTSGADVQTGGGEITAEFLGSNFNGSSLQTPAGDVVVLLSPSLKATIRAAIDVANGHQIRSDFPEIRVVTQGGQYGPKTTYAEGSLNGGGPVLRVRTTNGDINFRRAKK